MDIGLRRIPIPFRDDDVAFDAGGPRRSGLRQFALCDAVGPGAEQRQLTARIEQANCVHHTGASLARLQAPLPCVGARVEMAELSGDGARGEIAELMAMDAAVGLSIAQ